MGFSPQQVDAMSVWQFLAAAEGFMAGNDDGALTAKEVDELWEWVKGG